MQRRTRMRQFGTCWTWLLALALLAGAARAAPERVTNILGKLERDFRGDAYKYTSGAADVATPDGRFPVVDYRGRRALKLAITHGPDGHWHVGIAPPGWARYYLDDYGPAATLEMELAGSLRGTAELAIVDNDGDGDGPDQRLSAGVDLRAYLEPAEEWTRVTIPLRDFLAAEPDLDLSSMEKVVLSGSADAGESTLYVGELIFRTSHPERSYPAVKVDQVGYPTSWRKVAKVVLPQQAQARSPFAVIDAETGERALEGLLTPARLDDPPSGDDVYDADFTALAEPGTYVVEVEGVGRSASFRIGDAVYGELCRDVARFYFLQRCGMELKPEHAGPYAHQACHVHDEAVPDPRGGTRDARGGWHDAGDMNRYAGWTMHVIHALLTLHRHHPGAFPDGSLGTPESGNGVPDLLDEATYEIEWVRRMLIREGPDAGMVYDRLHESGAEQPSGAAFWERRHALRPPSDAAACHLVADCAGAYMVYREFPAEREFAEACLGDALLSWDYLRTRGDPPRDDYFSAAAVLFEATGRDDAHQVLRRLAEGVLSEWPGRLTYGRMDVGVATYALSERPEVDPALQQRMRDYLRGYADAMVAASRARGYGEPMVDGVVFTWGSNGLISKAGALLLLVNRFAPEPAYVETAREALHYLLGRNAVNQCMVTGYGQPPLGSIFHTMYGQVGHAGLPMPPGYLAGGVNQFDVAGISAWPAKSWRADPTCWSLTEPSIGYQCWLVYLIGALTAEPKTP